MPEVDPPRLRKPTSSLARQIVSVVFLATFLTAGVVSWISIHATYTHLLRRMERTHPAILAGAADRTARWMEEARGELSRLATQVGRDGSARLETWLERSRHFDALAVTDLGGRVLASASRSEDAVPTPPPETGAGLWTASGEVGMTVAAGSGAAASHRLLGILGAHGIRELLEVDGLGRSGGLLLVDAQGLVLGAGSGVADAVGQAQPVPLHALSSGGVAEYRGHDGAQRLGAALRLPGTPLRLVLSEPHEEAFQPVFAVVRRVFAIDLVILLVFGAIAHRITGAIVRPVEALSDGARRISLGEFDVALEESPRRDEIGLLSRAFNDMTRRLLAHRAEIEAANEKLLSQNEELQRANEVLEQLSITDGLTKLHNHRFFQDHLTREIKRVGRSDEPLSMLICDLDDFKSLNDRLGHAAGDELLVGVARLLEESIREADLLARYGGEEFVVLAPDTDLAGATTLAEKMREAVAEASFLLGATNRLARVTVSIGVASFQGDRKSFFHEADQALYRAKAAGKNCVRASGELPPDMPPEI